MHARKRVTCAGAIVFRMVNEGVQFLFILSKKGDGVVYGIPKGHVEPGEKVSQAAVREVFEETGVVPRLVFELPPVFTKNDDEYKTVHLWLAKHLNSDSPLRPQPEEVTECRWFSINDLPPVYPYLMPAIRNAIKAIHRNLP